MQSKVFNCKRKGSILASVMVAVIVWIMIAQSMFITFSGQFKMITSSRTALQAQQYAEISLDRLKNINYDELDAEGAHGRKKIEGITSDDWQDEVTIGAESMIAGSDDAKQRIATVNVYKVGDTLPRYTVEVPLSSQGNGSRGCPVGTIMWWYNNIIPEGYLLCNGQSTSNYPKLAAIVGNTVPNLLGKFIYAAGDDEILGTIAQDSTFTMVFDGYFPHRSIGAHAPDDGSLAGYLATPVSGADGHAVNAIVIGNRTFYGKYKPMHIACYPIIRAK